MNLLAKFLGLETISETLFYRIQKLYCLPAVQKMWGNVKGVVQQHLSLSGVTLSGDGRNDSPGHTAHYCLYTLMEELSRVVVDFEVVDKRETGGKSAAMEKLALSRLLRRLKSVLNIEHLVTDASTSIKALVRDMKGNLNHIWKYHKVLNTSLIRCRLALITYRLLLDNFCFFVLVLMSMLLTCTSMITFFLSTVLRFFHHWVLIQYATCTRINMHQFKIHVPLFEIYIFFILQIDMRSSRTSHMTLTFGTSLQNLSRL